MKVLLAIIYNHQYDKNIEVIEELYRGRFSKIVHLMPFYRGKNDNVICIYESSYSFQGYISQASKLIIDESYDYYFFLGDDCIINPQINENNLTEYFELNESGGFIKELEHLSYKNAMVAFPRIDLCINRHGIFRNSTLDVSNHLWYINQSKGKLKNKRELKVEQYLPTPEEINHMYKRLGINVGSEEEKAPPLLLSFSDLCIVPAKSINQFCFYCGVFAAVNLHAEVAIPSALALSCNQITTEEVVKRKGKMGFQNHENTDIHSLSEINALFKENTLFIHPIKLSKCSI